MQGHWTGGTTGPNQGVRVDSKTYRTRASDIDVHAIAVKLSLWRCESHGRWHTDICRCQVVLCPLSAVNCILTIWQNTGLFHLYIKKPTLLRYTTVSLMHTHIHSPPKVLEQWGQFLYFCCRLKTFGFDIKRWIWDKRSAFQLLFPGIHIWIW